MFYLEPISSAEWERLTNQSTAPLVASSRGHSVILKMADGTGPVRLSSEQSHHLIERYQGHDCIWNVCSRSTTPASNAKHAAVININSSSSELM